MKNLVAQLFTAIAALTGGTTAAQTQHEPTSFFYNRYTSRDFPRIYLELGVTPLNSYYYSSTRRNKQHPLSPPNKSLHVDYRNYGLAVERRYKTRTAKELPKDFVPGVNFISNETAYPFDDINEWNIYGKRNFYTRSRRINFGVQVGLNIADLYNSVNFQAQSSNSGGLFNFQRANYSYDIRQRRAFGLAVRAGAAFPLMKALGLSTYLSGTINQYHSYIGLDLNMMFGYVRK